MQTKEKPDIHGKLVNIRLNNVPRLFQMWLELPPALIPQMSVVRKLPFQSHATQLSEALSSSEELTFSECNVYFTFLSFHFKLLNSSHFHPTFNHLKCSLPLWSFPHSFPLPDMQNYNPFIGAPRKLCLVLYYYYLSVFPWPIHPCMTVFLPHIFEIFKP